MSYSRPDETPGFEPRDAPPTPDRSAWGVSEPSAPDGTADDAVDDTAGAGAPDDHTMPPPSPHVLHRLPAVAAVFVIAGGLVLGTQLERPLYAGGIAVLQLAMVLCVTWTRRVPGAWITLAVAGGLAPAADWVAVTWSPVSLLPVTVLLAAAFLAAAFAQLLRREHENVIESLGFTMLMCVAVCGYACYIALSRLGSAPPAMFSAVVAAATAVLAARAVDLVMPDPRINRQVPRGAFGIVIGTMCGTASAAYAGLVVEGPEPKNAAIGGLLVALTAVLVDLACGYMAASRRIDGEGLAPRPVIDVAGPLLAFAGTGPVVYLLSAYYIID